MADLSDPDVMAMYQAQISAAAKPAPITNAQIVEFFQQKPNASQIQAAMQAHPELTLDRVSAATGTPAAEIARTAAAAGIALPGAAASTATNAAAQQGTLAGLQNQQTAPNPLDVFKHDFKVDQGGTLTIDGKPLTDQQNAESSTPGTLGWAAAFMTNPAYANFVPAVKQQLATTGTLTPDLAMQIAKTGNPNQDDSPFMKALVTAGMFAPLALGIGAGGLAGQNLLSSGASGVTGLTADGLTIGNAAGINAPGAGFLNTAAGSTTSGILGSGGVFGSGVGINLSAGQIFAAEQALGTVGKGLLQLALSKGNTGIATQIIAQAAAGAALSAADSRNYTDAINAGKTTVTNSSASDALKANASTQTQDWLNTTGKEVNAANPQYLNDGSANPNYQGSNIFNGVTDFGQQKQVVGADGTKINADGVTTGNPSGGDLSNWGTQVDVGDPSKLNNGQPNPNWTDQYSTLPAGMLPYGKQVNLSNSKVLNDGTPNPAYVAPGGNPGGTPGGTPGGAPGGTPGGTPNPTGNFDWTKFFQGIGTLGAGALGADSARSYYNTLSDLAKNQWEVGAPSRARYEASMQPGFDPTTIPGYQGTLDSTWKGALAGLSTKGGNPFGNPGGLIQATSDVENKTAAPFLLNYQNQNANTGAIGALAGGYAGSQASAAAASGLQNNSLSGTLASLLNPTQQSQTQNLGGIDWSKYQISPRPI